MKMIKRICLSAIMLCLMIILIAGLGTTASAATYGDLTYSVSNGEVTITDCKTSATNVEIPKKINGYPVTAIGDRAFSNCTDMQSVSIPDSVTIIGEYAFYNCSGISNINIPDSVKTIGYCSFCYCVNLKSVIIPDSVISIGGNAFSNCTSLTNVDIAYGVTKIDIYAFEGCTSLVSISIPDSVTDIGYRVFENCTSLVSIDMPDYVENMGFRTFNGCSALKSIIVPEGVKIINNETFFGCTSLESVTIPDSVTAIGVEAFYNCTSLKNIIIPNNVEIIDNYAFYGCASLEKVTMSDSLTNIGSYAFYGCASLKNITMPDNLTKIGSYAFCVCSSLENVTMSDNITEIELFAFNSCTNLKSITIPDSLKVISDCLFAECTSLKTVNIPESVTEIKWGAFSGCESLSVVNYSGTSKQWNSIYIDGENYELESAKRIYHTYQNLITKATLTKGGKIENKCTICGDVKSKTTIYYPKTIELAATKYTYNGNPKAPAVIVKDSQGKTLVKGKDYTVTYPVAKTNAGKYAVTIKFKGNYSGTVTKYFLILPGKTTKITTTTTATTLKAQWNKVTGATGYKVEVIDSSSKVVKTVHTRNNYYTFSGLTPARYYKVKVTAYKTIKDVNNYSLVNATTSTYTAPATPTLTVSSTAKGKANFSWSNVAGETGYQIYCSTSANGTYSKVATYSANYTKGSKSNLTSGKTYYFKVRAYKKVGDTVYYSGWSTVKSVKIK